MALEMAAIHSLHDDRLSVLVWHYHDDDLPGPEANISLDLINLPLESGESMVDTYLVDDDHSNSYTTWLNMGSPQNPTPDQCEKLEESSLLEKVSADHTVKISKGKASIVLTLKRQGVTLLVLQL